MTETAALYAEVQAEVDAYRDEVSALLKGAEPLREELDRIDFRERKRSKESVRIFLGFLSAPSREVPDVAELISLRESLDGAAASIEEAGTAIKNVRENIAEVPVLWPLKGGIGHISMAFGYIPNPFTGIPYIHKGLDIGNYRTGDRIVAAADGVVAAAFYDSVRGTDTM
jgi:murein DD-endopeptidase MepM/ murein hydrolase activator NlpD